MRIDKTGKIGGYPILKVRDLLRRDAEALSMDDITKFLKVSDLEAKRLAGLLGRKGLLKFDRKATAILGEPIWEVTLDGRRMASAKAFKPISRQKAEDILGKLLKRIEEVRNDDEIIYEVEQVTVFGSYLANTPDLGDIDLVVDVRAKTKFTSDIGTHSKRVIRNARRMGKTFRNMADEFAYPQDMVKQRLKKVSRYLTFHSDHELKELGVKGKVIYRVPHR